MSLCLVKRPSEVGLHVSNLFFLLLLPRRVQKRDTSRDNRLQIRKTEPGFKVTDLDKGDRIADDLLEILLQRAKLA